MARLNAANTQATRGSPRKTLPTPAVEKAIPLGLSKENVAPKVSKQRQKKGSGTIFDIFSDDHQSLESTKLEADQSPKPTSPTKKKTRTLNLARTNSLLLPVQQRPRQRPNFKIEADDYDKENDLTEYGTDSYSPAASPASHQSPVGRSPVGRSPIGRSTTPVPVRNQTANRPMSYLSREAGDEDDAGDTSFDSLDDFIVSDNDDISFHSAVESASDSEAEAQRPSTPPSPPKSTRRRLLRGRRPGFQNEGDKNRDRSPNNYFPLEVKVPESIRASSSPSPVSDEANDLTSKFRGLAVDETVTGKDQTRQNDDELLITDTRNSRSPSTDFHSPTPFVDLTESPPATPARRPKSPTKQKTRIPPTPHRQSTDAFWSQDVTNDWNDQHSPQKPAKSKLPFLDFLNEFDNSDSDDGSSLNPETMAREPKPQSKTAIKKAEASRRKLAKARKQAWENRKLGLAETFLRELDERVNGGLIGSLSKVKFIPIEWSKTLRTTAGQAKTWKTCEVDYEGWQVPDETVWNMVIVLASHVITDEHRLFNTLTHEYCHLATMVLTHNRERSHGPLFHSWGVKCAEAMKDHPQYKSYKIHVTTKHDYAIDYKYQWTCQNCGRIYGRHSKSIDPTKASCKCTLDRMTLKQTQPKPRNVSPRKPGTVPGFMMKKELPELPNSGVQPDL